MLARRLPWWIGLLVLALALSPVACGDDDDDDNYNDTDDDDDDDNDDNNDNDNDDNDDNNDDDNDTTPPSWEDRCETLVDAIYDTCEQNLFDMTRQEALAACINETLPIEWECVVACWEDNLNCEAWYYCVNEDCDVPQPDDYLAPWPQENIEEPDYDESPAAGLLREKVLDYDAWHLENHQPYYGSTVETYFTDGTHQVVAGYGGWGDSCIWTGTYLGSQAFRYYVTGDAQARQNVIDMVAALAGHLQVTGRTGFIARYRAPQESLVYQGDDWCDATDSCHHIEDGEFAGDFWWGNTSRDQYTGWFFGMATAYDLIDDEPTRDLIRDSVTEVVTALIDQNWWILEIDGLPTDAGPNVLAPMQISWLLIAYHMTGDELFKGELQNWLLDRKRRAIQLATINFMNRYAQYYGNNLGHTNWYTLLRLAKVYFGDEDYAWFQSHFDTNEHSFTRLSHNAWFNGIYMSQGPYEPSAAKDPYYAQLVEDLTDFRPAPNVEYSLPDRTGYVIDPISVMLDDLMTRFPWLEELMGDVDPQAKYAFVVQQQCTTDFLWQRSPFRIEECGSDYPAHVNPGVDYLVAYWLATYHKFITKDM